MENVYGRTISLVGDNLVEERLFDTTAGIWPSLLTGVAVQGMLGKLQTNR